MLSTEPKSTAPIIPIKVSKIDLLYRDRVGATKLLLELQNNIDERNDKSLTISIPIITKVPGGSGIENTLRIFKVKDKPTFKDISYNTSTKILKITLILISDVLPNVFSPDDIKNKRLIPIGNPAQISSNGAVQVLSSPYPNTTNTMLEVSFSIES